MNNNVRRGTNTNNSTNTNLLFLERFILRPLGTEQEI